MYLKLGRQNLQYSQDTSDWMIVAEVVDSSLSFENPILVRTTDELDIWFGRNFPDYYYMKELIQCGLVLLLYKPILTETTGSEEEYIDLSEYTELPGVWLRDVELGWISNILSDPESWKFIYNEKEVGFILDESGKIQELTENVEGRGFCTLDPVREELPDQIKEIYNTEKPEFHVYDSHDLWIYHDGEILDVQDLPQNISNTSRSFDNRDTLVISNPEDENIEFTYLDYRTGEINLGIYKDKYLVDQSPRLDPRYISRIDSSQIANKTQATVFSYTGEGDNTKDYLVIPSVSEYGTFYLLYGNRESIPSDIWERFNGYSKQVNFSQIQNEFDELGYKTLNYKNKLYTYSDKPLPVLWFYNSKTFTYSPETEITEKIISKYMKPGLEMVSKTIGRSSEYEDDLIKVIIETSDTDEDYYRVTLSRYDYVEIFEGTLNPVIGEEDRLDFKISKESKLVNCELIGGTKLRLGTFYLMGASIEKANPEMYKYSLDITMSDDSTFPEFFLIPDKYKYIEKIDLDEEKYFNIYDTFLDISKSHNCQFLIENKSFTDLYDVVVVDKLPNPTKEGTYYKIGDNYYDSDGNIVTDRWFLKLAQDGGDFSMNLCESENRLIYFYRSLNISLASQRPGYYAFLWSIVSNEFSISRNNIYYTIDTTEDGFLEYPIESTLEKYKSNFLVNNNQFYYYKKYFSGPSPVTTIWMRFAAGKIERELRKHEGEFLGHQLLGQTRSEIVSALNEITNSFKIIQSIEMTDFESDSENLNITLETYVSDLADNHMVLDITLNFNKNNN